MLSMYIVYVVQAEGAQALLTWQRAGEGALEYLSYPSGFIQGPAFSDNWVPSLFI